MKKSILILFLLISSNILLSQIIFNKSMKTAFEKSKKENKLIFIEYYSRTCTHCKELEPFLWKKPVSDFYNKNFINYRIDTDNNNEDDKNFIRTKLGIDIQATPAFIWIDADSNLVHFQNNPTKDTNKLVSYGKHALDPYNQAKNYKMRYENGDKTVKLLFAYANFIELYHNDSMIAVLCDDLFKSFRPNDYGHQKSYTITKSLVNTTENGFFQYWIEHVEDFKKLSNVKTEKKGNMHYLQSIVQKELSNPSRQNWDLNKVAKIKDYIVKSELSDNPNLFFWHQEVKLLIDTNRLDEAIKLANQTIDTITDYKKFNYPYSVYLDFFKNEVKYLEILHSTTNKFEGKLTDKYDIAKNMILEAEYLYYINESKKATKKLEEAEEYFVKSEIPLYEIDRIKKKHEIE